MSNGRCGFGVTKEVRGAQAKACAQSERAPLAGCGKTLARTGIDLMCCRSIEEAATDAWQGPREWQAVQLRQRGGLGPTRPPVAGDPGTGERGAGASVAWVCGTVCR